VNEYKKLALSVKLQPLAIFFAQRGRMRTINCYSQSFPLHTPFVIARGVRSEARVVVVEMTENGLSASGECTPYPRYGESEQSVLDQIQSVIPALEQGMSREQLQTLLPAGAARNALDSALWSLEAAKAGISLASLLAVRLPSQLYTAQTVSIGSPEQMATAAVRLWEKGALLLKIKLDNQQVNERITAIRSAVPDATLIVDANESWEPEGLEQRCQRLAELKVAMLEQPLPAHQDEALALFAHPLPICADESCHTRASLNSLVGRYEMVNIKLDKTGGLTEALLLASAAREQGFEIMVGCMLCSSRAINAVLPLAVSARFADLDGPTWLSEDVQPGLAFACGSLSF